MRHDIPSGAAGIFCSLIPSSAVGLEGCRGVNEIPPSPPQILAGIETKKILTRALDYYLSPRFSDIPTALQRYRKPKLPFLLQS